jgi:hypothetical protein
LFFSLPDTGDQAAGQPASAAHDEQAGYYWDAGDPRTQAIGFAVQTHPSQQTMFNMLGCCQ